MVPSPTRVVALQGLGVPADRLDRLSAALRLPPRRPGSPAGEEFGASVLLLVGDAAAVEAPEFWQRPYGAWIEVAGLSDAQVVEAARRAAHADLFACVTTVTANRLHLAGRVLNGLAALHPMPEAQRDDMELALHEAISNAVVHGNLQVEGMKGLSVEALERFSHDLAARMADPAFAERRIEVTAWLESACAVVEVADEGTGFARPERIDYGASGRGLDLIAAIVEDFSFSTAGAASA